MNNINTGKADKVGEKKVPWTISDALIALVLFFVVQGVVFFAASLLGTFLSRVYVLIAAFFITYLAIFLIILYLAKGRRKADWDTLGFRPFNFFRGLGSAATLFFAALVVNYIYTLVIIKLGYSPPEDVVRRIPQLFGRGTVGFILAVVVVGLIAPIVEETLFRGFMYPAFRQRVGVVAAMLITSFLFAIAHGVLLMVLPIMVLGVALAYLYQTTDSLGPPIMLHSLNNLFSIVLVYYVRN